MIVPLPLIENLCIYIRNMLLTSNRAITTFFVATLMSLTIQLNLGISNDIVMIYYIRQNKEENSHSRKISKSFCVITKEVRALLEKNPTAIYNAFQKKKLRFTNRNQSFLISIVEVF